MANSEWDEIDAAMTNAFCLPERREWTESDYTGECPQCGKVRPLCLLPDPYVEAVFPEDHPAPEPYCYECYHNRKDDV